MTISDAKKTDMVDYLATLGHHPVKDNKVDYWYLSPLRSEKTPSFKINRRMNVWYDHGTGKGGSLVDFVMFYHQCSITEALAGMQNASFVQPQTHRADSNGSASDGLKIQYEKQLESPRLLLYLKTRKIPVDIAQQFCRQVEYQWKEKSFYAIGFKNDKGGFELRNEFFKGSSSPKTFTTIQNDSQKIAVFEGFFDFLSFQAMVRNQQQVHWNCLVLNSLSFFESARPLLEQHKSIHLFLDNDLAGKKYTLSALQSSTRYRDESPLYKQYKDVNEWAVNIGRPGEAQKNGLKYSR